MADVNQNQEPRALPECVICNEQTNRRGVEPRSHNAYFVRCQHHICFDCARGMIEATLDARDGIMPRIVAMQCALCRDPLHIDYHVIAQVYPVINDFIPAGGRGCPALQRARDAYRNRERQQDRFVARIRAGVEAVNAANGAPPAPQNPPAGVFNAPLNPDIPPAGAPGGALPHAGDPIAPGVAVVAVPVLPDLGGPNAPAAELVLLPEHVRPPDRLVAPPRVVPPLVGAPVGDAQVVPNGQPGVLMIPRLNPGGGGPQNLGPGPQGPNPVVGNAAGDPAMLLATERPSAPVYRLYFLKEDDNWLWFKLLACCMATMLVAEVAFILYELASPRAVRISATFMACALSIMWYKFYSWANNQAGEYLNSGVYNDPTEYHLSRREQLQTLFGQLTTGRVYDAQNRGPPSRDYVSYHMVAVYPRLLHVLLVNRSGSSVDNTSLQRFMVAEARQLRPEFGADDTVLWQTANVAYQYIVWMRRQERRVGFSGGIQRQPF